MEREDGDAAGGCTHDEATLSSAAAELRDAERDARAGQSDAERASAVEWSGLAGDSFRTRAAVLVAELAAVTAGVVGLGILVGMAQRDAAECASASSVAVAEPSVGPTTAGPRLPITAPGRALLPYESRGPLIPYESRGPLLPDGSLGPATAGTSSAAPGRREACR
ncbi:hypothetical protein SPF06_13880 [Sinomonas sp. JGH33]|uniref:Uncharacterized protein n=1 Tax=Sinomonas terricola TaxID=3110330 RepID=A0ABU5T806_9MICC|nr:hypothetical protein [Sinomonas sp. JGH33]MEA5455820.1 hypothetical protein [Sinomonas sp. JGH33]